MKASELRIGNLVYVHRSFGRSEKQKQVKEMTTNYIDRLLSDSQYIDPIPLDQDWLRDLGFKRYKGNQTDYWVLKYGSRIKIRFNRNFDSYMIDGHFVKLKYVHQLQNIVFALTEKELKYSAQ